MLDPAIGRVEDVRFVRTILRSSDVPDGSEERS
jgi:hypothetical protein